MTEQFGTAIKRGESFSEIHISPSYQVAKDLTEIVNSMVSEKTLETERLIVVRVHEFDSTEPRE